MLSGILSSVLAPRPSYLASGYVPQIISSLLCRGVFDSPLPIRFPHPRTCVSIQEARSLLHVVPSCFLSLHKASAAFISALIRVSARSRDRAIMTFHSFLARMKSSSIAGFRRRIVTKAESAIHSDRPLASTADLLSSVLSFPIQRRNLLQKAHTSGFTPKILAASRSLP